MWQKKILEIGGKKTAAFPQDIASNYQPLADILRPTELSEFYGQDEIIGVGKPLRKLVESGNIISLILWGPPGSGKTTLARIIAYKSGAHFFNFSAATGKTQGIKEVFQSAKYRLQLNGQKTIVFVDELHHFNKTQQDILLPYVEDGTIIFIGATTENPSFEIISPLLSRTKVFILKRLSLEALKKILERTLNSKYLKEIGIKFDKDAEKILLEYADGDARGLLNTIEFIVKILKLEKKYRKVITVEELSKFIEAKALRYDKKGEEHYNLISAYIKTLRDSDPDGALYWLARMIESGEDPLFIARRMVIFASEDVGNADPQALPLAVSVFEAVERIGLPEGRINLAQGTTYLACAPKSNASYSALLKAEEDAKKGSFGVPLHLRNPVTELMKKVGYGKGYKYAHNLYEKDVKPEQTHFPKEIGKKKYYFPKEIGYEKVIRKNLRNPNLENGCNSDNKP